MVGGMQRGERVRGSRLPVPREVSRHHVRSFYEQDTRERLLFRLRESLAEALGPPRRGKGYPFGSLAARPGESKTRSAAGSGALRAIGGFLLPPRGGDAQRPSSPRRGLWMCRPDATGIHPGALSFPAGFSPAPLTQGSLFLLLKGPSMDQALFYTKIHSLASAGLSILT